MKLLRFGEAGRERPGVQLADGRRIDASACTRDYDETFFANDGLSRLRDWAEREGHRAPPVDSHLRLGPPVARPSKIVCIGLNFRDHAAESGMDLPSEPVLFFKATSSIAGPNDDVIIPKGAAKLDWEVELALVIGRRAAYVERQDAAAHIAGFVLHNDYSERAFQLERGGQWVKGKSADSFAPLGPWLATSDEIADPQHLAMWLTVNGETRQKSTTANMIVDVFALVSYVSQFMTLLPGDIITTGTPAGVGLGMKPEPRYLRPGDVVELGIDGLGSSRQRVVAYQGA
jgi:2-keto-4-pentenoate hydratase/2-oxohepta-3-ene-1,7-dioic acid hydratase in catechol pathway